MKNCERAPFEPNVRTRREYGNEIEMRNVVKAAIFGVTLLALTIIGLALLSVTMRLLFDFVEKYWLFVFIAMAGALITLNCGPRKTYRLKRKTKTAKGAGGER
jgi:hypothetical protein